MIFFVPLLLSLSCSSFVKNVSQRSPSSTEINTGDLTFSLLKNEILEKNPSTIHDLLQGLADKYPSYFRRFTLGYESLSLHDSSFENPRAIVFGQTGKFIITFNGQQDQRAYSKLEIMEFSAEKGHEFREVNFIKEPGGEEQLTEDQIEYRTSNVTISKPNIAVCAQCHGTPARPIWQPYPFWPGFYSGIDNSLFTTHFRTSVQRGMRISPEADVEKEGYIKFILNKKSPRTSSKFGTTKSRYDFIPALTPNEIISNNPLYDIRRINTGFTILLSDQMTLRFVQHVSQRENAIKNLTILHTIGCINYGTTTREFFESQLPLLSEIPNLRNRYWQTDAKLNQAHREVLMEDLFRIDAIFNGHIQPLISSSPISQSRSERLNAIAGASMYNEAVSERPRRPVDRTVLVQLVAEDIGIDLSDFSINLRRFSTFRDGFHGFESLAQRSREYLMRLTTPDNIPVCSAVN